VVRTRLPQRFAITLALLAAASASADDWPQFLGPNRNGAAPNARLPATWPASGPAVVWQRKVGQGFAGPVVAGGRLVLFHRVGGKETVECLDAKSGEAHWSADYPTSYRDDFGFDEGPRATPAIASGRVFTYGAEGRLNAWDLATGKNLWSVDAKATFAADKGFFGIACSPLVEGNAVIVNVGGTARNAGVVAFEAADGRTLWTATDDEAGYSSPTAATIGGKRCIFSFTRAGLAALDPKTGNAYWHFPWRSPQNASVNAATPLVIDDGVFLTASYDTGAVLLRFTEGGPRKLWSGDDSLSSHYATPVYRDGFLYGYHGRQETGPALRCVELRTGKVRWSEDDFGAGSILLAGDQLLVLTEKGQLLLAPASPDGWKPTARAQVLGFDTRAYPALADGLLFARDKNKLVCLGLKGKP
jgi:outer membrane protein assembly factor BamB